MRAQRTQALTLTLLLAVLSLLHTEAGAQDVVAVRREYNQVAASIDTLVRLYGGEHLEALTERPQGGEGMVPAGYDLVLIFWADDEAEVFLNDFHVSSTRLTPVLVQIPSVYLRETNHIRAHCWDTDRVESGFMAGLYLRDKHGLRPVLLTEEGKWWTAGRPAAEIYYSHAQPEIPGARVIWGPRLFGEVELEARFASRAVTRAAAAGPIQAAPAAAATERRMETHEVVSRLVRLQARRQELTAALAAWQHRPPPVRYEGYVHGSLAFSLGRAGPLAEEQSVSTAKKLQRWADDLPVQQRRLVLRETRELKGVEAAIPAQDSLAAGGPGDGDRRTDYQAPPERGPVQEGVAVWQRVAARAGEAAPGVDYRWSLVAIAVGLGLYLAVIGRGWWHEFNHEVWRT